MHAAFAMHPCGPEFATGLILGIFGHPKANVIVKRH